MDKPNYYAIIPATVRYDPRLSASEKLLYGEMVALTKQEGYCWATNLYFANLYGVNPRSIQRGLRNLEDCKHIITEEETGQHGTVRKIYLTGLQGEKKMSRGGDKNVWEGETKMSPRIIHINNTSNSGVTKVPPSSLNKESKAHQEEEMQTEILEVGKDVDEDGNLLKRKKVKPQTTASVPALASKWSQDESLAHLRESTKEADKILAFVWSEKGYDFRNYALFKSTYNREIKEARKLVGYSKQEVSAAIDLAIRESEKLNYEWGISTVVKKIRATR